MSKTALLETTLLYNEYQAMERFGMSEMEFYLLPRDMRARKVAYTLIDGFMSVYRAYEGRPRGK
jgi:hypothetical protein